MGTETLPDSTTVAAGLKILSADFLKVIATLKGAFVGRNSSGIPTASQSLGTALYPWGNVYTDAVTIGGDTIDTSNILSPATRIVSGRVRATSEQPQFLQASGLAPSVKILASATDLVLSINSTPVTISSDITQAGLTTAPSSNNTCQVNGSIFELGSDAKYYGETDSRIPYINIDTVGSEISARVGQFISLRVNGYQEIMFGWLKSSTELVNVYRGFYFDRWDAPLTRAMISNNAVLTLLETGWVFMDGDGSTVDVTYKTPVYAYTAPTSPASSQYWYDLANNTWKRYSGSIWGSVDKVPLGLCVIDTSTCIATRSFDFYHDFKDTNTFKCEVFSDTVVRSGYNTNKINVYGTDLSMDNYPVEWDNTSNMETGVVVNDTDYYLYITTKGKPVISVERPYDRSFDLRGKYHPYYNWRYVAKAKTDGAADWFGVDTSATYDQKPAQARWDSENLIIKRYDTSSVYFCFDKLVLTNQYGGTKLLRNRGERFYMSLHRQGPELASTWYQLWIDGSGKLAMVPDLTGTTTGSSTGYLVDSGNLFSTYSVFRGAVVYNLSLSSHCLANSSPTSNGASLSITENIFGSSESYVVHITNPVGLDSFATNIGAVYNDSSSNLEDFRQTGRFVSTTSKVGLGLGLAGTYTAVNIAPAVPVTARKISGTVEADTASGTIVGFAIAGTSGGMGEKWIYITAAGNGANRLKIDSPFEQHIAFPQTIYYHVSSGSAAIYVSGYEL